MYKRRKLAYEKETTISYGYVSLLVCVIGVEFAKTVLKLFPIVHTELVSNKYFFLIGVS